MRQELQEWLRFLRAESNVLRGDSSRLFQQAMNQPDTTAPARAARARFEAGRETRSWFRWINKPTCLEPEVLTLNGHSGPVLRCTYAADKRQIVSFSQQVRHYADESDNNQPAELIWWDAGTGAIVSTHPLDVALVTSSAFSSDARLLALAVNPYRQLSKDPGLSDPNIPRSIKLIDTATGLLISELHGSDQQIPVCSFSQDGTRLISGDWSGTVRVWDVDESRELFTLAGHTKTIRVAAFSPSGSLIVTADNVVVKLWDARSGEYLRALNYASVTDCVFLSDERVAITSNELSIVDVMTGETLFSEVAGGQGSIGALGLSSDASVLVTGRGGFNLRLWQANVLADIGTLRGHEGEVTSVAFLQQGSKQVVSSGKDGTVRVWELPSTNELATFSKHRDVRKVSFLGNTTRVVSGGDEAFVRVWEGETAEELLTIPVEPGINALACTSDGRHLAIGRWSYEYGAEQGFVAVWRIDETTAAPVCEVSVACNSCEYSRDGKFLAAINEWTNRLTILTGEELKEVVILSDDRWKPKACTFSLDGQLLFVVGDDFVNRVELRVFRTSNWEESTRLKTGQWRATDCALSPDGTFLAVTSKSSGLITIEIKTGKVTEVGGGSLTSCAFSPDSRRLACGTEDKNLEIWDISSGKEVGVLAGHSDSISDCDWSYDGNQVVSCSRDGSVKLWNPAVVAESSGATEVRGSVTACRYSPDNRFVLTMGRADSALKLWNPANGTLVSSLSGPLEPRHFAFGHDPGHVLAGDDQGGLKLFTYNGEVIRKVEGDRNPINSFALSPQGHRLSVAAGRLRDVKIYDGRNLSLVTVLPAPDEDEVLSRPSFSQDGGTLIICSNKRLLFYDVNSSHLRHEYVHGHSGGAKGEYRSWVISPDGALLALLRKRPGRDDDSASLAMVPLAEDREIVTFEVEDDDEIRCVFSPDGRCFAIKTSSSSLHIWDVKAGEELNHLTEPGLSNFRYAADGQHIFVAVADRICVYDARTFEQNAEFIVKQSISSFDVAVDGQHLAVGGTRGNLLLLDAIGIEKHAPVVTGVSFYNFETQKWNKEPAVKCPWCGIVVRVNEDVIDAIREIQRAARLSPADVPSLSVPAEAWADPRLISTCMACCKQLKFNPFLNDFQNRLPRPGAGSPARIFRKLWRNSG